MTDQELNTTLDVITEHNLLCQTEFDFELFNKDDIVDMYKLWKAAIKWQ